MAGTVQEDDIQSDTSSKSVAKRLWRYAVDTRDTRSLRFDQPVLVAVGDPIFYRDALGNFQRVGEIDDVRDPESGEPRHASIVKTAEAFFYPHAPRLVAGARLTYQSTPDSLGWVIKEMLPRDQWKKVVAKARLAYAEHHTQIIAALRPVVDESLREALKVVEQDLPAAIAAHRDALERLGAKYQTEIVRRAIVPLVKKEIWPIVRRHAEPVADEIGKEIWSRVSLWRFGWRYLYDKTPFTNARLVRKEWSRFVDEEAMPILARNSGEFVNVVQRIMRDASRNPRVRAVLRKNLARIVDDPQLQRIVWQVLNEAIVHNPRFKKVISDHWTGPESRGRMALKLAGERLEPTVRHIAELLFGTRDSIQPQFARVLRNQVLGKDRRWLVLRLPLDAGKSDAIAPGAIRVIRGAKGVMNPFVRPLRISKESASR